METTEPFHYTQYLAAKQAIDDAALNPGVFRRFAGHFASYSRTYPHLRILEVGAGIGTMINRLLDRGLLTNGMYTALDKNKENLQYAIGNVREFARVRGWTVKDAHGTDVPAIELSRNRDRLVIEFIHGDILDFTVEEQGTAAWDVVLAHAILDILPLPLALKNIISSLRPEGLYYFTMNYDGTTHFEPVIDQVFDQQVEARYHASMEQRTIRGIPIGGKHSGQKLLAYLPQFGAMIDAHGDSDWVIRPDSGGYSSDTMFFLKCILQTVEGALHNDPRLDTRQFNIWMNQRYHQLAEGSLTYMAHQVDILGKVREGG